MGTAVFPDAQLKVFLVADADERARRRLLQRLGRLPGELEIVAEAAALKARDAKDAAQTKQAPDAVLIDTTSLTQEAQVERIVGLAKDRLARTSFHGAI
jgi:cytidylate kinase